MLINTQKWILYYVWPVWPFEFLQIKFQVRFENVILVPNFSRTNQDEGTAPIGIEKVSVDFNIVQFARKESKLLNQVWQ